MKRACIYKITNTHDNFNMRVPSDKLKTNYYRMKNLMILSLILFLVVFANWKVVAQEIETTSSELYLRSENNYGVLKFYNHGEMLLNKSSSTSSNAFTINVGNSSITPFLIRTNWGSPAKFQVTGTGIVYANGVALTSDSTAKVDIQTIDSQIENLKKLKAVSYKWKNKEEKGDKKSFGLLAQDLERVYPDMVFHGDSGEHGIYYTELIPVLLQVTQEQQSLIEEQAQSLLDVEKRLAKLEKALK